MTVDNLIQGLRRSLAETSQSPAVLFIENRQVHTLSWSQVSNRIEHFAGALKSIGVQSGDRVGIFSSTTKEWGFLDLAIMILGAVTVPIYPSSRPEEVGDIVQDSGIKVLLVENESLWQKVQQSGQPVKSVAISRFETANRPDHLLSDLVSQSAAQAAQSFIAEANFSEQQLATLIYTSGTSGRPKGVELTHRQINSSVNEVFPLLGAHHQDRTMTFLPFSHVLGRLELWGHYRFGYALGYAQSLDTIKRDLALIQPTVIVGVPRIFEKIYYGIRAQVEVSRVRKALFSQALQVGHKSAQLHHQQVSPSLFQSIQYQLAHQLVYKRIHEKMGGQLRFAVSGGAALNDEIIEFFEACGIPVLQGYGLTETTGPVTVNTLFARKIGSVGKMIGDVDIQFAEDGEILVKSDKVMTAYHHLPDETKSSFTEEGYLKTGDIGHMDPEGFLFITDRKKDLLKTSGGKFIAPQKIQKLFSRFSLIAHVHVHAEGRKYATALISLDGEAIRSSQNNESDKDLPWSQRDWVRQAVREAVAQVNKELASHETIKGFFILDHSFSIESGELTPSLKMKRKLIEEKYKSQLDSLYL